MELELLHRQRGCDLLVDIRFSKSGDLIRPSLSELRAREHRRTYHNQQSDAEHH